VRGRMGHLGTVQQVQEARANPRAFFLPRLVHPRSRRDPSEVHTKSIRSPPSIHSPSTLKKHPLYVIRG